MERVRGDETGWEVEEIPKMHEKTRDVAVPRSSSVIVLKSVVG